MQVYYGVISDLPMGIDREIVGYKVVSQTGERIFNSYESAVEYARKAEWAYVYEVYSCHDLDRDVPDWEEEGDCVFEYENTWFDE